MATIQGSDPGNVGRSMTLTAFSYFFVPLAALVSAPLLAQTLGVSGRGSVAAATSPLQLAVALCALGLPQSLVHFVAAWPGVAAQFARRAALTQVSAGLVGSAVLVVAAPLLAGDEDDVANLMFVAAIALPATLLVGVLRGIASGMHMWALVTAERCTTEGLKLLGFVTLWISGGLTVLSAVVVTAASPILGGMAYLSVIRRVRSIHIGEVPSLPTESPTFRDFFTYAFRIWIGSLSGILLTRVDQVIMTPLSGTEALGYYVIAVNVSDVALLANNAVRDVTLASDSARNDTTRATLSARLSFVLSAVVGLAVLASSPLWFTKFFGEAFAPAQSLAVLLVTANVLGVPGSVAGAVLSSRGFPGRRSASLCVAALVNLCLLVLLVPRLGALGAALATLVGNLTAANLNIWFMKHIVDIPPRDFYVPRKSDLDAVASLLRRRFR